MSEGKPNGADQSTSNGGGGGDPGGGSGQCSPIENGLQLRLKDQEQPLSRFTYAWAPTTLAPQSINWTSVTAEDVQYDHIRCHILQEGDDLPLLVTALDTNLYSRALILINITNNYHIDPVFLSAESHWNIPIVVITTDDGNVLTDLLKQHPLAIEARVTTEPDEPAQPQPRPQPQPQLQPITDSHSTTNGSVGHGADSYDEWVMVSADGVNGSKAVKQSEANAHSSNERLSDSDTSSSFEPGEKQAAESEEVRQLEVPADGSSHSNKHEIDTPSPAKHEEMHRAVESEVARQLEVPADSSHTRNGIQSEIDTTSPAKHDEMQATGTEVTRQLEVPAGSTHSGNEIQSETDTIPTDKHEEMPQAAGTEATRQLKVPADACHTRNGVESEVDTTSPARHEEMQATGTKVKRQLEVPAGSAHTSTEIQSETDTTPPAKLEEMQQAAGTEATRQLKVPTDSSHTRNGIQSGIDTTSPAKHEEMQATGTEVKRQLEVPAGSAPTSTEIQSETDTTPPAKLEEMQQAAGTEATRQLKVHTDSSHTRNGIQSGIDTTSPAKHEEMQATGTEVIRQLEVPAGSAHTSTEIQSETDTTPPAKLEEMQQAAGTEATRQLKVPADSSHTRNGVESEVDTTSPARHEEMQATGTEVTRQLEVPAGSTHTGTEIQSEIDTTPPAKLEEMQQGNAIESKKSQKDVSRPHSPIPPKLNLNGLSVRVKGQEAIYYSNYQWAPFTENPQPIPWTDITEHDVPCPHIRCHQISTRGEDLPYLITTLESTDLVVALILINNDSSYQIHPSLISQEWNVNIPILIIKSESGRYFKQLLREHDGNVEAKVEVITQTVVTTPGFPGQAMQAISNWWHSSSPQGQSDPKQETLTTRIDSLLFPAGERRIATEDSSLFQLVMSEFFYFEEEVAIGSSKRFMARTVLTTLASKCQQNFKGDFPLYMALAYRTSITKQPHYKCDALQKFVNTCMKGFENLDIYSVATTLKGLFDRADFMVCMKTEQSSMISAVELIGNAFNGLMSGRTPHQIRPTMLWITTSLYFCVRRNVQVEGAARIWQEELLKDCYQYSLSSEDIEGLKCGIALGQELDLPAELMFSTRHIGQLLAPKGERKVHFFYKQGNVLSALQETFAEEEFMQHVAKRLKVYYDDWIRRKHRGWINALSGDGTRSAAVRDGLYLVDALLHIVTVNKWNIEHWNEYFKQWFMLLLSLVDFNQDPQICLEVMLSSKFLAVKKYRTFLHTEIIEETRKRFRRLSVHQFFSLYNVAIHIWPAQLLEEYLDGYTFSQSVVISEPTWKKFIDKLTKRFPSAAQQQVLQRFLMKVAAYYQENQKAYRFIPDLLQLGVPNLFVILVEPNGQESQQDKLAVAEFEHDLRKFIRENKLKYILLSQTEQMLSYITTKKNFFQKAVLAAAYKEMIPETGDLIDMASVNTAMDAAISVLKTNLEWVQEEPSLKQKFCLEFICAGCTRIPLNDVEFDWMREYIGIIKKLGEVFCSYSSSRQLVREQTILSDCLPEEVEKSPSTSVVQYFKWIQRLHRMLSVWKSKLDDQSANYDDIHWYHQNQRHIYPLAEAVRGTSLVLSSRKISDLRLSFLQVFEELNQLLLKYISGEPKAGWCSIIGILSKNKVEIPQDLQEAMSQHILFPNEKSAKFQLLVNQPSPSTSGTNPFPYNQEIRLWLSKGLSLTLLQWLVHKLNALIQPILEHVDFIVYFELHPNKFVSTYLHQAIQEFTSVKAFISVPFLKVAIEQTKSLLVQALNGTASYGDLIAKGKLNLEDLNIDEELNGLVECKHIGWYGKAGLAAIKCLLRLFQFVGYIPIIEQVCRQYQLEVCLNDPQLREVTELAETLQNQETREKITPADAIGKWKVVCKALCIKEDASPMCLELFSKVADSADFSIFLKEKHFTGTEGETRFIQEFELITAQLEHNEYHETVLNHLFAAFRFIVPFLNPSHVSLNSLMSAVTRLDLPEGLPQLETVRNNMHLIRFWFSQTEGNVWNQLVSILKSGCYRIHFSIAAGRSCLQVVLDYEPSTVLNKPEHLSTDELQENQQNEAYAKETLHRDQIDDFVHKLGFLDPQKDKKEKQQQNDGKEDKSNNRKDDELVQHFLHLNGVAYKLLELFGKLRDLCHPHYSTKDFIHILKCSAALPDADGEVIEAEAVLREWVNKLEKVHSTYKWLLFFRVPKLMMLYEALAAEKPSIPTIINEVGFLFERDPDTRELLCTAIESVMESCVNLTTSTSPMDVAGSFLEELFKQQCINSCLLPTCYKRDSDSNFTRNVSSKAVNILHSAPSYSQSQLIRLVLSIYGGPPSAFEVLHCKPSTTEQDLKLFMERVAQHPRQYLVLEVNHLPYQLQEVLLQLFLQLKHEIPGNTNTCIQFVETSSSVLREVPWLKVLEYKEDGPSMTIQQAETICQQTRLQEKDFSSIELVYSLPGNGKTHYINEKLKLTAAETHQVTIAVNEAFSTISAIEKLRTLPRNAKNCAIFFNFTILPPVESAHEKEKQHYQQLMIEVGWFFFDLLFLCYVEDPATGVSFQIPGGLSWAVYVEVPSRAMVGKASEHDFLIHFKEEIPALGLLGTPQHIDPGCDYSVDKDVQLVCKYLGAFDSGAIDTLYNDFRDEVIKFSTDTDLSDEDCKYLLQKYMPTHIKGSKITQKLYIQYMKRRCMFLDNLPAFNYNTGDGEYTVVNGKRVTTDTRELGSTLVQMMLKEVVDFCDPNIKDNWSHKVHQQLIYDFKDGGGSLGLISLLPDELPREDRERFTKIGVETPSMEELYSSTVLHKYLSRSLNIPLKNDHLMPIQESQYVLTLDYTLKMLNIHERYECGIPVITEGETGVGKTALVEMLSKLWNYSWVAQWEKHKDRIVESMKKRLGDLSADSIADLKRAVCVDTVCNLSSGKEITKDMLNEIAQLPDRSGCGQFHTVLKQSLRKLKDNPIFSMLSVKLPDGETLDDAFCAIEEDSSEGTAHLLYIIFSATVKTAFHKLNVHAALQPKEIEAFFEKVFEQSFTLQQAYNSCDPSQRPSFRVPFATAYLDEINTASCLGLFKEIIVDRTIDGKPIPENVFIIASCNPHRGDILAAIKDQESWLKGTYYVRKLHPTLQFLMWDYGSLNEQQECEYVNAKMEMLTQQSTKGAADIIMSPEDITSLTDLILQSQKKMRKYAFEQLSSKNIPKPMAEVCAKSSVSQRDIQRMFTFYKWLMTTYIQFNHHEESAELYHRRAVMVSLGIVYFMRLDSNYRAKYRLFLDHFDQLLDEVTFSRAFESELRWYIDRIELPHSIAKTEALKENVFATIACTMTHTPLIIVGDPGSSKTLSFNIVIANFKGSQSRNITFRCTDVFKSLDAHFYQCSRRTTSNEVEKTFKRAITRQRSLHNIPLPVYCVVFMDEAGLPENKLESLKVLHYYLDRQEVSFVAISNHVLDAAKTNRVVSLFRPKATDQELFELAKGSILPPGQDEPSEYQENLLKKLCSSYNSILSRQEFQRLFGLRDFIHFVTYLRRKRRRYLDAQTMLEGLERNFNGSKNFHELCQIFFDEIDVPLEKLHFSHILSILKNSLADHISTEGDDIHNSIQSEVRYKLIIDPSEDDSLVRLLFTYQVLKRNNTRLYICSDFPGDRQLRVHTIAQIRHSVAAGQTILMCQTDEIHESFYDLFNQHFRSIKDPQSGTRHYTNIAIGAHSRPCRVDPNFQCVVVISESELDDTPAPFLNRFEKYYLTHRSLLDNVLESMPPCLSIMLKSAYSKVFNFILCVKRSSLYGFSEGNSLESLMLKILPPVGQEYISLLSSDNISVSTDSDEKHVILLETLLSMLQKNAGFRIPEYSTEELKIDADHIFNIIEKEPEFEGIMLEVNHENVATLIDEALHVLHHGPNPNNTERPFEIYTDALMIVAVLTQWIVNYLCKQLLQLMTPEALAVHCEKVPTVYLENYLKFQEHFSLKELVERQFNQLKMNKWDSSVCATKLLCFTRSSPLIHQLPSEYPSTLTTVSDDAMQQSLREHIYRDVRHLMICKVSLRQSQSKIEELLARYVMSESHLLLLIANMQEVSIKMINHLRIMIEEAENKITNQNKVFVLLLHFPPVMFFKPCYPSLFLMGWGHYYLDTIACGTLTREGVKSVVDVKEWFYHCCFPQSPGNSIDSQMTIALEQLLPEAIPIIASRVALTCRDGRNIMDASERTAILQRLLIGTLHCDTESGGEKPNEMSLGKVLCVKYRKYWTPQLMVQQIKQVSSFMYERESTLNITDSIQSVVRSTFFDFLVYMFSSLNERNDVHILVEEPRCCPPVRQLFRDLLIALPVPELAQIKVLMAANRQQFILPYFPRFPFFKQVCDMLDKAIDESRETVNQKSNILDTASAIPQAETSLHLLTQKRTKQQMEALFNQVVMLRVKEMKGCLEITASAMNEYRDRIWNRYFDDFVHYKLHLTPEASLLAIEILKAYIGPVTGRSALARLVSLHVRLHVYQMDLTKVTAVLKPISKMQQSLHPAATGSLADLSVTSPLHDPKSIARIPQTFVSLIVETLYTFALHMSTTESESESLESWYQSYSDIMSMPGMEENIILGTTSVQTQTQLRILHATFLVMQCCYNSESRRGQQVFKSLHSKYLPQGMKIGGPFLFLQQVVDAGLQAFAATPPSPTIQGRESYCVQSFIEGLFSFTFSKYCASFPEEDCRYFLEVANQQNSYCTSGTDPHHHNFTAMNVFKLYLSRILDEAIQKPQKEEAIVKGQAVPDSNELMLHNAKGRAMVGKVLTAKIEGSPGPYIPLFYQQKGFQCSEFSCKGCKNALMQQPLAHLYFLTVLEHLQSRGNLPNHLVRLIGRITRLLEKQSTPKDEKVLLFIEKQAVVQVLIQRVTEYFDPKDHQKVQDLFSARLVSGLNPLLSDNSMGGSDTCIGYHGLVFAMHLLRQLNSQQKLIDLLTDDQSTLVRTISGMKPLQTLVKSQPKSEAHLFPFIGHQESSVLSHFYQRIWETLDNVRSKGASQQSIAVLVKLAHESCNSEEEMIINTLLISKRNAFRMLLWLCVYYEFFVTKIHSRVLADAITDSLKGILEPGFISFIQSFLYPTEYMIKSTEHPPPLNENAPRLRLTENYQFVPLHGDGEKTDPIYELFNSVHQPRPDPSDVELCHAMANMVAVVLACPPCSNHLWYHMFAADGLFGTHMTGFMYKEKTTEGRLYDCGVELASDGTYGRPDYLQHATRGTLSLHSLYLILWANFGAFCMALVTQADAQEKICGPVISTWQSVRHYCVMQLRSVWLHIGNKLQLSLDERSFFIMQCMQNLLEVSIRQPQLLRSGKFDSLEELDDYEKMWHQLIFTTSFANVHEKFAEHCKLTKNALFRDLSCLEVHYPHFPTMDEFSQTMLSSVDIGDVSKNKFYVLSKFVLEYPRLQAAGALLPDLLEFYQWIHTELAYLVTRKYAENESIEAVITTAEKKYAGIDLNKLYERVKDGYNKYAEVTGYSIGAGACANNRREGSLLQIEDATKLMHFLSVDAEDQWEGSDLLRVVLQDIITFHNNFLQTVFNVGNASEHSQESSEHEMDSIHPNEVNEDTMIIGKTTKSHGIDEHLHLVRSRYLHPIQDGECPFDLERLQNDVIKAYLLGKPLIRHLPDRGHDQILFKFKKEHTDKLVLEGADLDLTVISGYIAEEFKPPLDVQLEKALEYEFYTANYHTLVKVLTGLKVATEYLIKSLQLPDEIEIDGTDELKQKTLPEFLLLVFKVPEEEEENIMGKIGMKGLTQSQLEYLLSLKLPFLYSTLEQFVEWVKDGMYDFHQLPLVMRKHLDPQDEAVLNSIRSSYAGTADALLQEMQTLTEVLVHSESDIRNTISKHNIMQKPIMKYLEEYGLYGDEGEQLTKLIPNSVLCQHYVALRIFLRRKIAEVQSEISARSRKQVDSQEGRWVEFVKDLWDEERLKHLWDVAMPYVNDHQFEFDPATQMYGFQSLLIADGIEAEEPLLFILTEEVEEENREQPVLPEVPSVTEPQETTQPPAVAPKISANNTDLQEIAENITVEMVTELMHKWKLDKYQELFSSNDIDGYLLFTCSEKDLEDLGVTRGIDRRRILRNIKKHVNELAQQ